MKKVNILFCVCIAVISISFLFFGCSKKQEKPVEQKQVTKPWERELPKLKQNELYKTNFTEPLVPIKKIKPIDDPDDLEEMPEDIKKEFSKPYF